MTAGSEAADAGSPKWAVATYDFAVDGGAISTIALLGVTGIPTGAIVLQAFVDVLTIPVGVGASIALQCEAAGDLQAAAAISGAPWSTAGRKNLIAQDGSTSLKTTAARDISAVISAAVLTAGKFTVYAQYIDTSA